MLTSIWFLAFTANAFYVVVANDCTGANEEYVQCPGCAPQTCDSIGHNYNCPEQPADPNDCKGACRCKSGYVRNKNNECVAADCYCTDTCGGDRNAQYGCGISCITCSNYQASKPICPRIQCPGGCDCKPNYVKDTNTNKCVLPKHCSKNNVE